MSLLLFGVVIFSLSNSVMGGQLDDILNKRISDFRMIMEVEDLYYGKLLLNIMYPIHISELVRLIFRIIMSFNLMKNYMCTIHFRNFV